VLGAWFDTGGPAEGACTVQTGEKKVNDGDDRKKWSNGSINLIRKNSWDKILERLCWEIPRRDGRITSPKAKEQ
jgi:hypothetical protein